MYKLRILSRPTFLVVLLSIFLFQLSVFADVPTVNDEGQSDSELFELPNTQSQMKRKMSDSSSESEAVENQTPSESRALFTPKRRKKVRSFYISPASKMHAYAIYLIHDSELDFEKVDFGFSLLSSEDFIEKISALVDQVSQLRKKDLLHTFHRYIGLVSVTTIQTRKTFDRFREHATTCNSTTKSSEKRLCIGLKLNAKKEIRNRMSVLVYNVHPSQIKAIEAHFIKLFGGLEDLGWNSNPGDLGAKSLFDSTQVESELDP